MDERALLFFLLGLVLHSRDLNGGRTERRDLGDVPRHAGLLIAAVTPPAMQPRPSGVATVYKMVREAYLIDIALTNLTSVRIVAQRSA